MIGVIDIGISNIKSVCRALDALALRDLDAAYRIVSDSSDFAGVSKIILPGVGSFAEASSRLDERNLRNVIREEVLGRGKPILGICLGMQLLAEEGDEGGSISRGLGLLPGRVSLLRSEATGYRVPHIGWNNVSANGLKLFSGIAEGACFYFIHSYEFVPQTGLEKATSIATCNYGVDFAAAVESRQIYGAQFHPEKSQRAGLSFLENFARIEGAPC